MSYVCSLLIVALLAWACVTTYMWYHAHQALRMVLEIRTVNEFLDFRRHMQADKNV